MIRFGSLITTCLSLQYPIWRTYARFRRATLHRSVRFNGKPLVRCMRGAQLLIHNDVKINTSISSNPVIGHKRTALCAMAPGALLVIESNVGISSSCICAAKSVTIGESTIIGADCLITDTDFHAPLPNWKWSNDCTTGAERVVIGKGCFIGSRSMILKGVTIGDGCVIAAGAVVSRSVPPLHLAYGNPATYKPLSTRWMHPDS